MMLRKMLAGAVAVLALFAGCEQSNAPDASQLSSAEMAELREMILSDPLYTSDAEMLNDGDAPQLNAVLRKSTTPIIPLHWGRKISNVERDIVFDQVNDTTVVATLTYSWEGTLYIVAKYSLEDTARTLIEKPFAEQIQRNIVFYKKTNDRNDEASDSVRSKWKPAEVSGVQGGSENSQVVITQLEIEAGDQTIVITNPLEHYFELKGWWRHKLRALIMTFGPSRELTVRATVVSADPDTDWVSIHWPRPMLMGRHDRWKPHHERMELISETPTGSGFERVFEGKVETYVYGRHTFFVTAVTRSTIFDDVAPVSTQIWGVPFITE